MADGDVLLDYDISNQVSNDSDADAISSEETAMEDLSSLMDGPDGVRKVGMLIDEAMSGHLAVLSNCRNDESCFLEHQLLADPPENLQGLMEEYLGRILGVWQAAADIVSETPANDGADVLEVAKQWYFAALVAARAALAVVECLQAVELAQFSLWMDRCSYSEDLYSAAVQDQNRLGQEFERAYSAFVGSAGAGQGV